MDCHLNGGRIALAAAIASGARWIRVYEGVNAYISHAGLTEGIGGELARYRHSLRADDIKFMCDVNVKHGSHFIISDRTIEEQAHDAESEGAEIHRHRIRNQKGPDSEKVKRFSESVKAR